MSKPSVVEPWARLGRQLRRPFVLDAGVLQGGALVNLGIGLLLSIGLARALGRDGYGSYALVVSATTTISLFKPLGQDYVATTNLASAYARLDHRASRDSLITFNVVNVWSTLLVIPLALALAPGIASWFFRDEALADALRLALLPALWAMAFATASLALQCSRRMLSLTVLENANSLMLAICSLGMVWAGTGVSGVFLGQVAASLVAAALAVAIYKRLASHDPLLPSIRSQLRGIRRTPPSTFREFRSGLAIALDKNLVSLYALAPILVLGSQAPTAEVALLRVAMTLLTVPTLALSAVSRVLMVKLPELKASQPERVRRFFLSVTSVGGGLSIALTLPFALLAPWLLALLYGPEFAPAARLVSLVALVPMLAGFDIATGPIYRTYGRNVWGVYANLAVLCVGLPLVYGLTQLYGLEGTAIGYTVLVTALRIVGYLLCLRIVRMAK